jgi:hypothetical protein
MNTIYYTLTSEYNGINYVDIKDIEISKGKTEVTFDLSQLSNQNSNIIRIEIVFGDGSPNFEKNYAFEENYNILSEKIRHIYYPDSEYSNIIYYPTVVVTYSNFNQLIFQLTLKISKSSIFSDYKGVVVSSIQFIDDEDNSIFTALESLNGDILNLKIK